MLDEKTRYVLRNRGRLRGEAAKARHEAAERLQRKISDLEEARADAVAAVEAEQWAAKYPGPDADA